MNSGDLTKKQKRHMAKQIKVWRESVGMSQSEMATVMDVTLRQVQRWESDLYDGQRIKVSMYEFMAYKMCGEDFATKEMAKLKRVK